MAAAGDSSSSLLLMNIWSLLKGRVALMNFLIKLSEMLVGVYLRPPVPFFNEVSMGKWSHTGYKYAGASAFLGLRALCLSDIRSD